MLFPDKSEKERAKKREFRGKKILRGIWKKREVEYVSGEILLKLKNPASADDEEFLRKLFSGSLKNAKIIRKFDRFGVGLIDAGTQTDVLKTIESLAENAYVEYAEPNMLGRVAVTIPNDPDYPQQWSLPKIDATNAWDIERGNANVLIAVLDTGIAMNGAPLALSHPDLSDPTRIILGSDYIHGTGPPRDDFGHGTHVAGIASADSNNALGISGLSWGSRLYIVKVWDNNGNGVTQDMADAIKEAVDYAVTNNYRLVINISGGWVPPSNALEQAVIYARNNDCLIVAAVHNHHGGSVTYPAAYSALYDNVIAVSATDSNDAFAPYSNKGPEVNVSAPGTRIFSTMPNYPVTLNQPAFGYNQNYDSMSGTSMATPHVAALAALILSRDSALSPLEVRDTIETYADDLGIPSWDEYYGYGRIDAYQSLNATAKPCSRIEYLVPIECIIPCLRDRPCQFKNEWAVACKYDMPCGKCDFLVQIPPCGRCEFMLEGFPCIREGFVPRCPADGFMGPRECISRRIYPEGKIPQTLGTMKHIKPLTKRGPLSHKKRYYTRS